MAQMKEGGGTLGLEQAAIGGWGGEAGACAAGEGGEKGGEADHDVEWEWLWRGGEMQIETGLCDVLGGGPAAACVCVCV